MGGGQRTRKRQRGSDLRYDLEIELEDSAFGTEKTLPIPRYEKCERCEGTGAENPDDISTCDECNGRGTSTRTQRTPFGMFSTTSTCRKCRGEGKYFKKSCQECKGKGIVRKTRQIEVKIPAGAVDGTSLRIQNAGEVSESGANPGDLYVVIHLKQHKIFERHDNDVYLKVPLAFTTAALGGEIEVPTLKGKADLKIPSGTQSNTIFRLKGMGIPNLNNHYKGDQNVEVVISVPEKLTKKQKELIKELDKESENKGFLKGMFG